MKSNKTTVTLEDLLRVKRAEQPPAEFWSQFERDMRAKQLAAIVEPRPWWAPFIRIGARAAHFQLPVGAAAILVVSFITIREYRSPELNSLYLPKTTIQEVAPEVIANLSNQLPSSETQTSVAVLAPSESMTSSAGSDDIASAPMPAVSISHSAQVLNPPAVDREPSPSERYIAANLAAAQAADPTLMDDVFGPSMRQSPARQPMRDPLAQVAASGESRRSRLLATALPVNANSGEAVLGPNDRVARHLTEERLYDTISRVGLKGDRVAIKF